MSEFKRINAKKILVVFSDAGELSNQAIHDFMLTKGKIDQFKIIRTDNKIDAYVIFDKKVNVTSKDSYQFVHGTKTYIPAISSFRTFPGDKVVEKLFVVNKDVALKIIVRALTDREDQNYQDILKEDPNYPLMQALDLSHYHIISIIICGLHTDKEFQQLKLEYFKEKLYNIKYLNYKSEELLRKSVLELNPADTRHLLNIFRGVV